MIHVTLMLIARTFLDHTNVLAKRVTKAPAAKENAKTLMNAPPIPIIVMQTPHVPTLSVHSLANVTSVTVVMESPHVQSVHPLHAGITMPPREHAQ
jgi:hypothetical protein